MEIYRGNAPKSGPANGPEKYQALQYGVWVGFDYGVGKQGQMEICRMAVFV